MSAPLQILHVIVGLEVGGAELMLQRLLEAQRTHPHYRHRVISLTTLGTVGAQLRARGTEVTALGLSSPLGLARVMWRLVRAVRSARPDLVQTWMYHADLLGGIAARLAGCRRVIWGVRTTDVKAGSSRLTALLMRVCAALSRRVPHTIVCAAAASARFHVAAGYDASRITVVPNGFDAQRFQPDPARGATLRAEAGLGPDTPVVGTVGRFNSAKDHRNFVRAAALLAAVDPALRFLMVGRGLERSNAELMEWIAASGHAERFILLGQRADVPACLAAMDVFCLASKSEGFPNVVGEAMGMAVPCVATDVGDAAFLLGDTGVVVAPSNEQALADGVAGVLALAPAARRAMGARARARLLDEFSMARACERFEAVYQRVMASGGAN